MESPPLREKHLSPLHLVKWKYGALSGFAGITLYLCQYILKAYPTPILSYLLVIGSVVIIALAVLDYREQLSDRLSFREGWILAYTVASIGLFIQLIWLLLQVYLLVPDSKELYISGLTGLYRSYLADMVGQIPEISDGLFWKIQCTCFVACWIFYLGPTMIIAAFLKRE